MLFASTDLAARIETAAADFIRASVRAVARARPETAPVAMEVAGGIAAWAGDGSPLNKVAGLGFGGPVDPDALAGVEHAMAERGAPVQVELASLAEPGLAALFTERGYRLIGFENVLGRALAATGATRGPEDPTLTIDLSDKRGLDVWMDAVVTGFGCPDADGIPAHEQFGREALERVMADMAAVEGMVRYLARVDGEPAGGGSMYLSGGIAQLSGAATLPRFRRRGIQTALLARRLVDAAAAGADLAVVTTQPGSTSQRNMERHGFQLLYTRVILSWSRPP